ncbi:MAG: type II toxin-antitoxin system RelE/ParE family toxin [Actinobacteria bacterium]|nr:type II toxin-antitoxin system RelE/ParE family toxin [Actinomycetota bacterium]
MSWKVEIKPNAAKQYRKLDKKTKSRIIEGLRQLEQLDNPFLHKNIRPLTGELKGDWRLRIGDWRVLLTPDRAFRILHVYAILPRGDAYK